MLFLKSTKKCLTDDVGVIHAIIIVKPLRSVHLYRRLKRILWKPLSFLFFSDKRWIFMAVPADLNTKFISKFNCSFTNCGCLHCAIHSAIVFKILGMFKNNIKFSNVRYRQKHHAHDILILSLFIVGLYLFIMVEFLKVS